MADKEALKRQLNHMVDSLKQEGMLDDVFSMIHSTKDNSNHLDDMPDILSKFCNDARDVFAILTYLLGRSNQTAQGYYDIGEWGMKLHGSAMSLGAPRLSRICLNIRQAALDGLKEQCLNELKRAKDEFSVLQEKLQAIAELWRKIDAS